MNRLAGLALGSIALASLATAAHADAVLKAQYLFDNNLNSSVAGAPALTATDPLLTSGFQTDTVFGNSRTVYHFDGANSPPADQGGLTFDDSSSLITSDNYSIDLVLKFDGRDGGWRRLVDVENRQSDDGFYVDPSNHLDIFPVVGAGNQLTSGNYYNVALTVASDGTVDAYLDDQRQFSTTTALMDIDNPLNPGALVNLFLDNVIGGGQGEWSSGDIALANFYDGVLTADQVSQLVTAPLPTPVPEPGSLVLLGSALVAFGARRRLRRGRAAI